MLSNFPFLKVGPDRLWRTFAALWLLLCAAVLPAGAGEALVNANSSGASLNAQVDCFVDTRGGMDLQEVIAADRFKPTRGVTGWGHVSHPVWFRLTLVRAPDAPGKWWLETHPYGVDDIRFFQPDGRGGFHRHTAGEFYPFSQRAYPYRQYLYPLDLPAGQPLTVYFLVKEASAVILPLRIWQFEAWAEHGMLDYLLIGLCAGVMAGLAGYNLLLFVRLRDRLFLLYFLLVGGYLLLVAELTGLGAQLLWPHSGYRLPALNQLIVSGNAAFVTLFALLLLRGGPLGRWFTLGMSAGVAVYGASALTALAGLRELTAQVLLIAPLGLIPFLLVAAVYRAIRGFRPAWYYLVGYGPVLVGISLVMGVAAGSLPATPLYESLYIVAGAWEAIFFSQALAERFNLLRREKGQVQQLMLEEKTTRLEEARRHAAELEDRVLARTRELEASNAALAALSATDGLTGIANRRRFDEVLLAEWQRAGRTGQAVSLGLLDVDDFKKYNDHYGHQAGDDCLRTIASTLAASIRRSNDLVARYGGEEFAFIAPATDAAQALAMADHVRQRVEALQLPHAGSPYGIVTISVGVAVGLPAQACTVQALLKGADDALYRAKQQGRNRSVLAE